MDIFVQQVINCLVLGSMYSLIAIGFTLYFGVLRVIHFAQGELFMLGAFSFIVVQRLLQVSFPYPLVVFIAFIFALLFTTLVGLIIERIAFKPFRQAPPLACLVSSLGFSILIREAVLVFFPDGANPQGFPTLITGNALTLYGVSLSWNKLLLIVFAISLIIAVSYLIQKTLFGKALRAVSLDSEAAEMQGIDVDKIIKLTFILGSVLAVIAGILSGASYGSVKYDMGFMMGIKGFTAAVIGGLGKLEGALLGGFLLAFLEIFSVSVFTGLAAYKDIIAFISLILMLTFFPTGLLASKMVHRS